MKGKYQESYTEALLKIARRGKSHIILKLTIRMFAEFSSKIVAVQKKMEMCVKC